MVHKTLKLKHHRHTAKKLAHKHTSFRGLVVVLAVTALCMSLIQGALADDVTVEATVPSSTLNQPAVITQPASGTTVSSSQLQLKGTCQVVIQGSVVTLERDSQVIGSQLCQSNGKFAITVTLIEGLNTITPKVVTAMTNTPGPDGPVFTVTYTPPVVPPPSSGGSGGSTGQSGSGGSVTSGQGPARSAVGGSLPIMVPNQGYIGYRGNNAHVNLVVSGGTAPYTITINWGDGSVEDKPLQQAGAFKASHKYKIRNGYTITLIIRDTAGNVSSLQMAAVGLQDASSGIMQSFNVPGLAAGLGLVLSPTARLVWGSYFAVSFATIALWFASPAHGLMRHLPLSVRRVLLRKWTLK